MKKTLIALSALAALSAPAFAGDYAVGAANGHSVAKVGTLSGSATGGLATGNNNGTSMVRNESGAAQLAGARSELTFTEIDGARTTQGITRDVDGIDVTQINEAFVDGYDFSKTTVRDRGVGTGGVGASVALRSGNAWSAGGYHVVGSASW